jgi:glyoxylase-like metal-dependent hydrolase (beta-lactamase superfamily II)
MRVGEVEFQVIHTPGHTPGCVCFWFPKEDLLVSGDTLFQGSIGRLDLPTARPKLMWGSLQKLAQLPANTRVIPGHGQETTIGAGSVTSFL